MSTGLALGLLTLYYTWRTPPPRAAKDSIFTAAILGGLYYVTAGSGIFYPGALWVDPEFGTGAPQVPLFTGLFATAWIGAGLEILRLGKAKVE
jgi:hypothetical protein